MPLRDHFRPPLSDFHSWEGLHGQWPAMMVVDLNSRLPAQYIAEPRVHLGSCFEIDATAFELRGSNPSTWQNRYDNNGGVATAVWAPPQPTFDTIADLFDQYEYEVRIYDTLSNRRLVAAVEIVSPANKDRPEHRNAFVSKCEALLRQRVSVTIVDLVTTRQFNLYGELLDQLGQNDASVSLKSPRTYAVSCHWVPEGKDWHFRAWTHALNVGEPLPTLPLWLSDDLAVPLWLESSYEDACRVLRIA